MEAVHSAAAGGLKGLGTVGTIFLEASINVATSASVILDLRYGKKRSDNSTQRSEGPNLLESLDKILQNVNATSFELAGQ